MFKEISINTGLFLILLGFNIGILSGFFGVGGCFILTPLLNILGLPMADSVGTGLFFAVVVSFLGGIKHYFAGNTLIRLSIIVGLIIFIGIRISQPLVLYLDKLHLAGYYIRLIYIITLLILGLLTWKKKNTFSGKNDKYQQNQIKLFQYFQGIPPKITIESCVLPYSIWPIAIIAFAIGCLQGFLGVGGGFILVPVLILFFNLKPHHAVRTSLITILVSSIFATFLYL